MKIVSSGITGGYYFDEWKPLFSFARSARLAISRPSARTVTNRQFERSVAENVAARVARGEPALCFSLKCSNELHTLPAVFMFLRTADGATPVAMGVCKQCAQRSKDELRAIVRDTFGGPPKPGGVRVGLDIPFAHYLEAAGIPIIVAGNQPNDPSCAVAAVFVRLLENRKLPRFRNGIANCHALVNQLYLDLKDIGAAHLFAFKRGSSALLKSTHDPKGSHSWAEANGWAIDAANGSAGNPVLIMRTDDFCHLWQLTNIHDIPQAETQSASSPSGPGSPCKR